MLTTKSHQKHLCVLIETFVGEIWPITCMYWSPYLEFRLPSPLTLSTWQTCSYPVNLAQFSTTPRNRLWALLPWMCPSLTPLCYLSPLCTFLLYLFSWYTLFVCLSHLLACGSLEGRGYLSLTSVAQTPEVKWLISNDHGRKRKWPAHKTRKVVVTLAVMGRVLKTPWALMTGFLRQFCCFLVQVKNPGGNRC